MLLFLIFAVNIGLLLLLLSLLLLFNGRQELSFRHVNSANRIER